MAYEPSETPAGEIRARRARALRLSWKLRPYAALFVPAESFADRINLSELLPGYQPRAASQPARFPHPEQQPQSGIQKPTPADRE